jgi:predicted RNA-binding Zn-ribbon protein involved in translation (DUF1610 family)
MSGIRFYCTSCGQHLEAPAEASGCPVACPSCQTQLRVPAESEPAPIAASSRPRVENLCAICQSPLNAGEPQTACPECKAAYHSDCWEENGGCAIYGCSKVPEIEQRRAIEIPISYWGMENKPCPNCGFQILAAAVRCRNCGAKFASARPEEAGQYYARTARDERLPATKRSIMVLFVFCVVPCLAPIGAVWGLIWYSMRRDEIKALPSVFPALCKIGIGVAIGQCVLIVLLTMLYAFFRSDVPQ